MSAIDLVNRVVDHPPFPASVLHGWFPLPQANVLDADDDDVGFTDHQNVAQFLSRLGSRIVAAPKGKECPMANAKNKFLAAVDGQTLLRHT